VLFATEIPETDELFGSPSETPTMLVDTLLPRPYDCDTAENVLVVVTELVGEKSLG
jgi:hypothetical protein